MESVIRKPVPGISSFDRSVLRRLAEQVSELAARPVEKEKRDLWYRHNSLEPTRPLVFCDPENGWYEIITDEQMQCTGALAREWELILRTEIFREQMNDDKVIEPSFTISYSFTETDCGMHENKIGGTDGGSYTWESPLKTLDDVDTLHFPDIIVDYEATKSTLALARETFGDILDVRLAGRWWWSLGMTLELVRLRGLEQIMIDMCDDPEGLHRLMAFLRDWHLRKLDFLETNGLLTLNCDGTYVGSGGFGYTTELPQPNFNGHIRTRDMWGFCESQETVGVSAAMFEEFVFAYQLPILERFGLNCYGCCEPLDKRWHVVKKTPGLRRVSVSAWANLSVMAEMLTDKYVFSMKPNPADLARPEIDKERIRAHLRMAMETTRGCRVEVIMKDNHTIGKNPQNVIEWCRIAKEEADRLYD